MLELGYFTHIFYDLFPTFWYKNYIADIITFSMTSHNNLTPDRDFIRPRRDFNTPTFNIWTITPKVCMIFSLSFQETCKININQKSQNFSPIPFQEKQLYKKNQFEPPPL